MKIRSLRPRRNRRGFTLVEIMVVMTIIAILISILVPAVGFVRETARGSQCRSSLRQFFIGFTGLADGNKQGQYTTGAYDPERDGCVDSIGWVADLVNAKVCKPQELLCPSNPAQASEKLKEYMGSSTAATGETAIVASKLTAGVCGLTGVGSGPNSTWPSGAQGLADHLLAKGYGTNHMTTWFMSRSAAKTTSSITSNNVTVVYAPTANNHVKGLAGSRGPLTRRMVDQSPVTANTIPLMGDSATGDIKDRFVDQDIIGSDGTVYYTAGSPLVESFSDGPMGRTTVSSWQEPAGTATVTIFTSVVANQPGTVAYEEQPPVGQKKMLNNQATNLQDYRDFGVVHSGAANVLFADGSVKSFTDTNGDGFLNPGFAGTAGTGSTKGYTDDIVELPAAEIFSGILLEDFQTTAKGNFDG